MLSAFSLLCDEVKIFFKKLSKEGDILLTICRKNVIVDKVFAKCKTNN